MIDKFLISKLKLKSDIIKFKIDLKMNKSSRLRDPPIMDGSGCGTVAINHMSKYKSKSAGDK